MFVPLSKQNLVSTIASIIHCLKSAQKFAARVCQVATVVMETTQLVLSQFKNFLPQSIEN